MSDEEKPNGKSFGRVLGLAVFLIGSGALSYALFANVQGSRDTANQDLQTLKKENCRIVEIIQADPPFSDIQYRYKCESGMSYTTLMKI